MFFGFFHALCLGIGAVAGLMTWALPLAPDARLGAAVGTILATATGVAALWLKRWAMSRNGTDAVKGGLLSLAIVFALRAMVLAAGLLGVSRLAGDRISYVVAFFIIYLMQQALEVSYVHLEQKRLSQALKGA